MDMREDKDFAKEYYFNIHENIWLTGIMGLITGDALGYPVYHMDRSELKKRGMVTGMEGNGYCDLPKGVYTDSGAMTLALLASINETGDINLTNIMDRLQDWLRDGFYTPTERALVLSHEAYDAVMNYQDTWIPEPAESAIKSKENASLKRILPACLYVIANGLGVKESLEVIHKVSWLTNSHTCCSIGCGIYYFMIRAILRGKGKAEIQEILQEAISEGMDYYGTDSAYANELGEYDGLKNLEMLSQTLKDELCSNSNIVHTLETAVWAVITTDDYRKAVLSAVNLGGDTATIAAVTGSMAALWYGYSNIPPEWVGDIKCRGWIRDMCTIADVRLPIRLETIFSGRR